VFADKSEEKHEKLDWKPLYLDAQATTPMVIIPALSVLLALEICQFLYSI